ncbi:MAG: hypothetical protein NTZ35_08850, partial [Ignavibacteriales bacterium]|nr:hypothetical protein [Ignavibacteriales bacterium]
TPQKQSCHPETFRFMNPADERNPEERDFRSGSQNEVPNILRLSGLNKARFAQEHFGTTLSSWHNFSITSSKANQ